MLTTFLLAFGFIPFGILIADRMKYATRRRKYVFWISLAIVGSFSGAFSFWNLTSNWFIVALSTFVFFIIYTTVFVSQRIWVGERDLNEVLRSISLDFLALDQVSERLSGIPALIGKKLQHDRVFILEPTSDQEQLCIVGEYADVSSAWGQMVPVETSITGKAFTEKESIVWNEVRACPYYHRISSDDTKAEIAVPIMYQGTFFYYQPADPLAAPVKLANGLDNAIDAFIERDGLVKETSDRVEGQIASLGLRQSITILTDYYSKAPNGNTSLDERLRQLKQLVRDYTEGLRQIDEFNSGLRDGTDE
jgi:hypothetical protein